MDEKSVKPAAVLCLLTALGLILFWIGFFTVGLAPDNAPPCYLAYEHSFPLPDLVLAAILALGGWRLLKNKPSGRPLALMGAGGLLFLGLVDAAFNLQNGIYLLSTMDLVLNAFINLWCVALAVYLYLAVRR